MFVTPVLFTKFPSVATGMTGGVKTGRLVTRGGGSIMATGGGAMNKGGAIIETVGGGAERGGAIT
jgi:hypothetical protein